MSTLPSSFSYDLFVIDSLFPRPSSLLPLPCSLFPLPSSLFPFPSSRPSGMRGAIESAAHAVWQALACHIESRSPKLQISNLQISDPPLISPQRPRAFRPADPN